ncbi:ABC transporter substrate-binding protein [Brevibacillus ginsengisoli]|uniref:ABC transporter substrate-binding protein n=1 Tax=Brevibacillus ginsengisoli TaxID=363854 RepID=UPI003CECFA38
MLQALHFLELRSHYNGQEIGKPFSVTVDKLTDVWHCTPRYTKLIVRRLCELGWIEWQSGRGRGNTSMLTLRTDPDDILFKEVMLKMEQGHVKESMDLMSRFGAAAVKDQFMEWLSNGMGCYTQAVSDKSYDSLRFPVFRSIVTLDPGLLYYGFDFHMAGQVFDTLVQYDQESKTIQPCIAHSWEKSDDDREWTFHLKKNVMFHHGRELNAHDVVFSLERLRSNPNRFASSWMFQDIEQLKAIDYKTVQVWLKEPNYLFLRFLCTIPSSIVPEEIVRKNEAEFGKRPIGTGPFRMTKLNEGICILEAFPEHFNGRPHLDRVEALIFPETESGRLKEPDWDSVFISDGDASKQHREAFKHDDWYAMEKLTCCTMLVFNQGKPGPQSELKFRQAIHHMIDRKQLIADLGGDRISVAPGFHPASLDPDDENASPSRLSHSEIMALLNESGYCGESFHLATTSYHEADAVWLRDRLLAFGIQTVIDFKDPAEMADQDTLPQHDCLLFGNSYNNDEVCELEMYLQKNYFLSSFNEQAVETVQKATQSICREPDANKRQQMLQKLEDYMKETHSVLYLVQKKSNTSYHKSVHGVTINPFGWLDFRKIWFHPNYTPCMNK